MFSLPVTELAVPNYRNFILLREVLDRPRVRNQREQSQIGQYGACLAITNRPRQKGRMT